MSDSYRKYINGTNTRLLNSVNQLIFVMVTCGVLLEVRTGFLNTVQMCSGCKGLIKIPTQVLIYANDVNAFLDYKHANARKKNKKFRYKYFIPCKQKIFGWYIKNNENSFMQLQKSSPNNQRGRAFNYPILTFCAKHAVCIK
jgi:hypothetical protein